MEALRGSAAVGVRGRVVGPPVGLDLDDPPGPLPVGEQLAEQPGRHHHRVAGEQAALDGPDRPRPGTIGAGPVASAAQPASASPGREVQGEPGAIHAEAAGEPFELVGHRDRARRRPAWSAGSPPRPGSSSRAASSPRSGWAWTSSTSGHVALDRVAHQAAHQGVGLAERHALLHQQLGQVDGRGRRPVGGRLHAVVVPVDRGEQAGQAPAGPAATWRTESKSGSLSSCRSRL